MSDHQQEPLYIRQNGDLPVDERRSWFRACLAEAISEGATWGRFLVHPEIENLCLVEAWKERPENPGEPRFGLELAAAEASAS